MNSPNIPNTLTHQNMQHLALVVFWHLFSFAYHPLRDGPCLLLLWGFMVFLRRCEFDVHLHLAAMFINILNVSTAQIRDRFKSRAVHFWPDPWKQLNWGHLTSFHRAEGSERVPKKLVGYLFIQTCLFFVFHVLTVLICILQPLL